MNRKLILLAILAVVGTAELLVMVLFYYLGIRAGWLESLVDTAVLIAISAPLLHRVLLRSERAVREGKELARAHQSLKGLYDLADALKEATNEQDVLNNTLQQVMKFPGVQAGWVSLREGETGFRLAAADGLPPALEVPGAFEGECLCRRKLLAGELDRTTNILECERLRQAKGDTRGLRLHASIPLWIGNRVIGVMNLAGPEQGLFGDKDLEILYSVGNQVAVALERTHLLHQMEKTVEERTAALTAEITERQQVEEKLLQSDEQFRRLFFDSPLLMWVWDLETLQFLEANDAMIAHYGYSREEFLTMGIDNIRLPEQATPLFEIIEQIRADGKSRTHCWQVVKKGEIIELEIYWQALEFGGRNAVLAVAQDITGRRRAEEEKARLLSILEVTTDLVGIADIHLNLVYLNSGGRKMLGVGHDEDILGHPIGQYHAEWARALVVEEGIPAAIRDGVWMGETAFLTLTGQEIPTSQVILAHKAPDGTVQFFSTIVRDITEHKESETVLRKSEEKFRKVLQNIHEVVYSIKVAEIATGGPVELVSNHVRDILGYEPDEFLRDSTLWFRILHPEDVPGVIESTNQIVSNKRPGFRVYRLRHKTTGEYLWLEDSVSPEFDDSGNLSGIFGVARDISERKWAEEALRASEGKYRQIVETTNEGIWMLDPDGKTIFANRQMAQMMGCSEEELSQLSLSDFTYDSDLADARARVELHRMEVAQRDIRYRRKDGSELWAHLSSAPVFDATGKNTGILGMLSDITERKLLENQFRQAQKMEAVGRLAGGVAHDFNNLLGVIIGYSELVEERLKPDDPLRPKIEEIKKAGQRGAALTRQLLVFSRQQVLEPKILNLNSVLEDVQKMLQRLIGEDIELVMKYDPNLALVKADRGQIEQVIMNLAVNSRDAMPNGGKLRIETANVDLDEFYARQHTPVVPGSYVMLVITDTGVGMDAETQTHIFEPFFTTKALGKGTGLGLATVYGIVKQSGGYVWVYSELGQGTTFKIYLPQVQGEAEKEQPSIGPDKLVKGTETILLVEDEEALRKMTRELLEKSGYTVLEAGDGLEALEIGQQHKGPIHLLLTDVVMPRMGGPALAKSAAVLHPELKVLYMSGYTGHSDAGRALLSAESELLQKPFTRDALLRKMREMLGV